MRRVDPQRIKQARLQADHSLDSLAREIGTSATNTWRWENGKHQPQAEFLYAIAQATGKPLEFFFVDDTLTAAEEQTLAEAQAVARRVA